MYRIHQNFHDLAERIGAEVAEHGTTSVVRPFHDAWGEGVLLLPGQGAWPNYRSGAFRFTSGQWGSFAGLMVAKGLDKAARGYIPGSTLRMDPENRWQWDRMSQAMAGGALDAAIATLAGANSEQPVTVRVGVSNGLEPGFDPWEWPPKHYFHWTYGKDGLQLAEESYALGPLRSLTQARDFRSWWQIFSSLPEYRWYWVTCLVGWESSREKPEGQVLAAHDMWQRLFLPLFPWFGDPAGGS